MASGNFDDNVNLTGVWTPGKAPLLGNNVNFASVFAAQGTQQTLKNAVNFRSRFDGYLDALATGRFREHFYGG
jgi:hypothetical protein